MSKVPDHATPLLSQERENDGNPDPAHDHHRHSRPRKHIPIEEAFHLNMVEKLIHYHVVPWKFLLNIVILCLLLAYAFYYQNAVTRYHVDCRYGLARLLFDPTDQTDASLERDIPSIGSFLTLLEGLGEGYYSAPKVATGIFQHFVEQRGHHPSSEKEHWVGVVTGSDRSPAQIETILPQKDQKVGDGKTSTESFPEENVVFIDDNETTFAVLKPRLCLHLQNQSYRLTVHARIEEHCFDIAEENVLGPFSDPEKYFPDMFGHSVSSPSPSSTNEKRGNSEMTDDDVESDRDSSSICAPTRMQKSNPFLPCRNNSLGVLFDHLLRWEWNAKLRSVGVMPPGDRISIQLWYISFAFSLSQEGRGSIRMKANLQQTASQQPPTFTVIVSLICLPLALWDIVLRLRQFHRYHVFLYEYLPNWIIPNISAHDRVKEELRRQHGMRVTRSWAFFALFTDVCIVLFCCLSFADDFSVHGSELVQLWKNLFLAMSVLFVCLLFISYLQTVPRFYVLIKTLSIALPYLLLYLIGVLPMFIGYAVCGTVVFGGYTQPFSTMPWSMTTLFCMMNGDSLLQLFTAIDQQEYLPMRLFSMIFLASFLGFFILNVLNIALAIVQDSYNHVKEVFEVCQFDEIRAELRLNGDNNDNNRAHHYIGGLSKVEEVEGAQPQQQQNNFAKSMGASGILGESTTAAAAACGSPTLTKKELREIIQKIQDAITVEEVKYFGAAKQS